jgi:hypothetical protein
MLGYFENNAPRHVAPLVLFPRPVHRLRRRRAGLQAIIGRRLKQSAMRWTVGGADAITALRCC